MPGDGPSIVNEMEPRGFLLEAPHFCRKISVFLPRPRDAYSWGFGQLRGADDDDLLSTPVRVSPLVNVTAVAVGEWWSLAVTADGDVYSWGFNMCGQLGDGTEDHRLIPALVSALDEVHVTAVAAGIGHGLALTADGDVYSWGYNAHGRLGDGIDDHRSVPALVSALDEVHVTAIAAGSGHSLAVTADGDVYSWGFNKYGRLGDGITDRFVPALVSALDEVHVTAVAAGSGHSLALTADGEVYSWGDNRYGQLGDGIPDPSTTGVPVPSDPGTRVRSRQGRRHRYRRWLQPQPGGHR